MVITNDTLLEFGIFQEEDEDDTSVVDTLASGLQDISLENDAPSSHEDTAYEMMHEMLTFPLRYGALFKKLNVDCPRGIFILRDVVSSHITPYPISSRIVSCHLISSHIILYQRSGILLSGPPGVGKTFLTARIAKECQAKLFSVHAQDIVSPFAGDSERILRDRFLEAKRWSQKNKRPCVLFIDELDALAPRREEASQQDGRIVAQLLTLMGKLTGYYATN